MTPVNALSCVLFPRGTGHVLTLSIESNNLTQKFSKFEDGFLFFFLLFLLFSKPLFTN